MRRQTYKEIGLRVTFNLPGIGQASAQTNFYETGVLIWCFKLFARTKLTLTVYVVLLMVLFCRRLSVDARERGDMTNEQFANLLDGVELDDWVPTAITITGETTNIAGMEAVFERLLLAVKKAMCGRPKAPLD
jgi:hypothetical protein